MIHPPPEILRDMLIRIDGLPRRIPATIGSDKPHDRIKATPSEL